MHVITSLIIIVVALFYADWKNWKTYHSTMLFMAMGNLLYNFLTAHHFLWRLDADFLANHTLTELLYTFVVFPLTVLLFLGNYPKERKRQYLHVSKWVVIYIIWEIVFVYIDRIDYQYGWTIYYSILFDFIMFPTLIIHHKNPLLAYLISAIVATSVIWWFNVPVHLPIEMR